MIYQYAVVVATSEVSVNKDVPHVCFGFCQKSYKVSKSVILVPLEL